MSRPRPVGEGSTPGGAPSGRGPPAAGPGAEPIDKGTPASYLPAVVQRRMSTLDGPLEQPEVDAIPGALLFADVSGFTALTELMAARGPAGVETLTRTLNDYFGRLIEVITEYGGDVLKFAGDALVVGFAQGQEPGARPRAVLRAAACALAAQRTLAGYTSEEGVALSLKIAVSAGRLTCAYLGGVWGRWEMIVLGRPLAAAGDAAESCDPGAVVLSSGAWELVASQCAGQDVGGGVMRLQSIAPWPQAHPIVRPVLSDAAAQAAWTFLPGAVRSRLQQGLGLWLAELRRLTVVFVTLPGHPGDVSLSRSQELMVRLQQQVYRVEGSVNKISVDDKGLSLIAALGMPPLSHEDDPRRGLTLALAIREILAEMGFECAIGVTTGRVYCGVIGSDQRCEYTLIGDAVNLSARLMVASRTRHGFVLCDQATRDAAEQFFAFEAVEPLTLKGKKQPIQAFKPAPRARPRARRRKPLVGRVRERALIVAALDQLEGGVSSVVWIEAGAGVGKSHLVAEARVLAEQRPGVRVLHGEADAIEKATAYIAWRGVLLGLLDLEDTPDLAECARAVAARLAPHPRPLSLAPVLEDIVPLGLAPNDTTGRLVTEGRVWLPSGSTGWASPSSSR